jgi:hypothetical protein
LPAVSPRFFGYAKDKARCVGWRISRDFGAFLALYWRSQ